MALLSSQSPVLYCQERREKSVTLSRFRSEHEAKLLQQKFEATSVFTQKVMAVAYQALDELLH